MRRTNGSFPGTGSDDWHRALTGRQSPEPVSAKLRMIYGNIVSERLPDNMLDLLSQLDSKSPKQ
ncbi:MAG: NepR family anti-sigma factor [Sphingopyxis sp.]